MSLTAATPQHAAGAPISLGDISRALSSRWIAAALTIGAVASQAFSHQNGDNSWLFTVAEKTLDGATPYVDFIESNPPVAYLMYAPAVWVARLAHIPVEPAAVASILLLACLSLWLTARVLLRAGLVSKSESGFLLNAGVFALVFLPGFSFAEREHNACLLVMPALALYVARCESAKLALGDAIAAGLMAGVALAIKPYYALALAAPLLFLLAHRRSLAPVLAPEQLTIAAAVAVNVAAIAVFTPAYFDIAPATFDVYLPMKEPLSDLLREVWFMLNAALLATLGLTFGRACRAPKIAVPALASLGFMGTFLIQGKGWVNHGLPGVELAFLAVAAAIAPVLYGEPDGLAERWLKVRRAVMFVFAPLMVGAPILFGVFLGATGFEEYKGLTAAVLRAAPAHPKIIAISPRLDVGHPLTRRVGGEWVGRPNALWLMMFSQMFLDANWGDAAKKERLRSYVARDARGFREDVEKNHPDIVLVVEKDKRVEAAMRNSDIAVAMGGYALAESADGIGVWTRKPR